MPGGWKPVTELETNILITQTEEVVEILNHGFRWVGENIELQPRITAAAEREVIRSHPASPTPLIRAAVVRHTEEINPAFENIRDLGQEIMQIGATTMQQLQL